ncbi:MAG: cysteine hydrolase [Clostridia bacterium]|nr:cysteine hydrolase [Clostridia bacterium]
MKVLIVVDMQNDFIDGALGTNEAVKIVPFVKEKIGLYRKNGDTVIFTRDTHEENYMDTVEGKNLPVPHCIRNTEGREISKELDTGDCKIIDKPTFGSTELAEYLKSLTDIEEIELIGLCTDICVISNTLLIKAAMPETKICVDSSCCAGVTPESHENALNAMKMCHIEIK